MGIVVLDFALDNSNVWSIRASVSAVYCFYWFPVTEFHFLFCLFIIYYVLDIVLAKYETYNEVTIFQRGFILASVRHLGALPD